MHNPPPKFAELRRREPTIRPGPLARYQTKFVYDVWGDTVNTASRVESHLLPGHIQGFRDQGRPRRPFFELEQREIVEIKGKA